MTASHPSKMAVATSEHSALVGDGESIMLSSICVATMTGLPCARHSSMISFWTMGTSSAAISTPKSPRATMMPSDAARISSKLSTPSWFSIFEMTSGLGPRAVSSSSADPCASASWHRSRCAMHDRTLAADRTKDAAMKSAPFLTAHSRSDLSLSVRAGRSRTLPGRLTPLRALIGPLFSTTQRTPKSPMAVTLSETRPSSRSTAEPTLTVVGNFA
mmetsp:Transcript_19641/g.67663  ORF Transcript_19641/g.67663 Transcript_19641/m.67663 type:complete len:216 (+) Transcript_19641:1292-1939(+)